MLVLPAGTPLSDALEEMWPELQRAARDPVALARVEVEWPAALVRRQAAGLYAEAAAHALATAAIDRAIAS